MDVDAPSPDPQIGEASKESIQLARDQFAAQQALLQEYSPLYKQQMQFSLDQQAKNAARSDDAWNSYNELFKPLEEKMATTVANYDTADRRNQAASLAQAGVASEFDNARQGLTERLAAQNASGGGRGLAMQNALAIEEAKAKAGAGDAARRNVEATGLSLLGSATNFGRGLTNTGLQTGQMASANGQGATGMVSGLSGLTGAGYSQALQGYGVGINGLLGNYQAQANASNAQNGIFGDLLGAGAGIAGMFFKSSKDAKRVEGKVDGKKALRGLRDVENGSWTYKPGMGDEGSHVGPYAESAQKHLGDKVAPGGKAINMIEMSKVNAQAIGELARIMDDLESAVSALEVH